MVLQWNSDILSLYSRVKDPLLVSRGHYFGFKGSVPRLIKKKRRINSKIYINQVLNELRLPFFNVV